MNLYIYIICAVALFEILFITYNLLKDCGTLRKIRKRMLKRMLLVLIGINHYVITRYTRLLDEFRRMVEEERCDDDNK